MILSAERLFNLSASCITIFGFLVTITHVPGLGLINFEIGKNTETLLGSWFLSMILLVVLSVSFGFGFGTLLAFLEHYFGRIMLVTTVPLSGLISGFQTSVMTLILVNIFGLSSYIGFVISISVILSALIETTFIFHRCEQYFPIVDGAPKFSSSIAAVNLVFFVLGAASFAFDSHLLTPDWSLFFTALVSIFLGVAVYLSGFGLYFLIRGERIATP